MVSAVDSGASIPVSSPGWGHCVVFLGKTLKWVPANLILKTIPAMDLHPILRRFSRDTPSRLCYRNRYIVDIKRSDWLILGYYSYLKPIS